MIKYIKKIIEKEIDNYNMELFLKKLKYDFNELVEEAIKDIDYERGVQLRKTFKISFDKDTKIKLFSIKKCVDFDEFIENPFLYTLNISEEEFCKQLVILTPDEALDSLLQYQYYYDKMKEFIEEER